MLEVDALWRFTNAAVAVSLDNVRTDLLDAARSGDDKALRTLTHASSENEEKAVGALLERARRFGRDLHVFAHPGTDLIDALDPGVIRSVFPRYPETHNEADAAWKRESGASRKAFYQEHFGVEYSVRAYPELARAHRDRASARRH